jgi:hypothetical protein
MAFTPQEISELRKQKAESRKQQVKQTAKTNSQINFPSEAGSALTLVSEQSHANGVQLVKRIAETSFAKGVEDAVAAYFAMPSDNMMQSMFPDGLPQIEGDVTFAVTPLLLEGARLPEPNV